jgi:hypothetical protein
MPPKKKTHSAAAADSTASAELVKKVELTIDEKEGSEIDFAEGDFGDDEDDPLASVLEVMTLVESMTEGDSEDASEKFDRLEKLGVKMYDGKFFASLSLLRQVADKASGDREMPVAQKSKMEELSKKCEDYELKIAKLESLLLPVNQEPVSGSSSVSAGAPVSGPLYGAAPYSGAASTSATSSAVDLVSGRPKQHTSWPWSPVPSQAPSSLSSEVSHLMNLLEPELQSDASLVEDLRTVDHFLSLSPLGPNDRRIMINALSPPPLVAKPDAVGLSTAAHQSRMIVLDLSSPKLLAEMRDMAGPVVGESKGAVTPAILLAIESFVGKYIDKTGFTVPDVCSRSALPAIQGRGFPLFQGNQHLLPVASGGATINTPTPINFGGKAPRGNGSIVSSASSQSTTESYRQKVNSRESQSFNSVYGATGGFPPEVRTSFKRIVAAGVARVENGKSALHPNAYSEVQVYGSAQRVLVAAVHLMCIIMSETPAGEFAKPFDDQFILGEKVYTDDDPGFPNVLEGVAENHRFYTHCGAYALALLKAEAVNVAPVQNNVLLRSFYSLDYSGEGGLAFAERVSNHFHRTCDALTPVPGSTSHPSVTEASLLDFAVNALSVGFQDETWRHKEVDRDLMRQIVVEYERGVVKTNEDLLTRLRTENRHGRLKASLKQNPGAGASHALGVKSQPLTLPDYMQLADRVKQCLSSNLPKLKTKKLDLYEVLQNVTVGAQTVVRWRPRSHGGVILDQKVDVPVLFPSESNRRDFWNLFHSTNPKSSQFLKEVADAVPQKKKGGGKGGGGGGGKGAKGGTKTPPSGGSSPPAPSAAALAKAEEDGRAAAQATHAAEIAELKAAQLAKDEELKAKSEELAAKSAEAIAACASRDEARRASSIQMPPPQPFYHSNAVHMLPPDVQQHMMNGQAPFMHPMMMGPPPHGQQPMSNFRMLGDGSGGGGYRHNQGFDGSQNGN